MSSQSLREEIGTYLNSDNSFEKNDIDKLLLRFEDDIKNMKADDVGKLQPRE